MNAVIGGNYFNKYESKNPLVKLLMKGFLGSFDALIDKTSAKTVYECGCGEGYLSLRMLKKGMTVSGCDIVPDVVGMAQKRIADAGFKGEFIHSDIVNLKGQKNIADLIVCCEVLEHTEAPETVLQVLSDLTNKWCILSVPNEPWWCMMNMARGKYLSNWGNTPGHIQHWSSHAFVNMIKKYFDVVEIRRPFPWTMVLCHKRP